MIKLLGVILQKIVNKKNKPKAQENTDVVVTETEA